MAGSRHLVTIKGVKDGLVFLLDDVCDFADLIQELKFKLEKTHQQFLSGPIIHVNVKLGARQVSDEDKELIRGIIRQQGNLLIQSIESDPPPDPDKDMQGKGLKVIRGIVRSGQTVRHEGSLLFIGDVNPGGTIECTGDIYVLGSLRGMAHAGAEGNEQAFIAASHLKPTQLRIGTIISRPPDEWGIEDAYMEFAYIRDGKMEIDKIHQMHRIRPGAIVFKESEIIHG